MSENPQSHLDLDATHDVIFQCDLCEFVAYGPTPLEAHIRSIHSVPAGSVAAVPVHAVGATPITDLTKKRGRPRKIR